MKVFYLDLDFTEFKKVSIVSGSGLVPNRRQVIIWTNVAKFTDAYMLH